MCKLMKNGIAFTHNDITREIIREVYALLYVLILKNAMLLVCFNFESNIGLNNHTI